MEENEYREPQFALQHESLLYIFALSCCINFVLCCCSYLLLCMCLYCANIAICFMRVFVFCLVANILVYNGSKRYIYVQLTSCTNRIALTRISRNERIDWVVSSHLASSILLLVQYGNCKMFSKKIHIQLWSIACLVHNYALSTLQLQNN